MCTVGYVIDGKPYVTPTLQWREGNTVYWHGSSASRALKNSRDAEVCLSVAILDGFVMARSGMHHSLNTRSVTLFGTARQVSNEEKEEKLCNFIDHLFPGRSEILRPNSEQERKATMILALDIEEGSAKIRTGPPADDEEDYELPIWAGVIPVTTTIGAPIDDPRNLDGLTAPDHVTGFKYGKN